MARTKDITNQRFHYLVCIRPAEPMGRSSRWWCKCDCGNRKIIRTSSLLDGAIKSCGCKSVELSTQNSARAKHRMTSTVIYRIWIRMKAACYNVKDVRYHMYGAKGIVVDDRWLGEDGFAQFYMDMGDKPLGHKLARFDDSGNFSLSNCYWVRCKLSKML